jgi:zinc protease
VDKPDQTQSQVRLGAMAFRRSHPDYLHSQVVNAVLGGGFTSRLVDEIRVNRGLSYGASSFFDPSRAAGTFQISTFTKTETTHEIISVALQEVAKMQRKGPRPSELAKAKQYLCGLYPLRLETNESLAGAMADVRVNGLGDDYLQQYRGRVMAATPARAAELAARWFLPEDGRTIAVVGRAEQVIPQLEGLGAIERWKAADLG